MNSFNRKLNKLKRDPKQFFVDMHKNHVKKKNAKQSPESGHYHYTVISAVYNVEKYLDDYFKSLVKQKLPFKKHIKLVLVDDGSVDSSAQIIKKWQKLYPENITYLYKENGGQASARNMALSHVDTPWVTFIDPDDFVDERYFLEVDKFLFNKKDQQVKMLGCNMIFYIENHKEYRDAHPLKYRFSKGESTHKFNNLDKKMQLSASSAFFQVKEIISNDLSFDSRVKPNFEDASFIAKYMASINDGIVGFTPKAKYFYRKREDGSSTIDTSWLHEGKYSNVLEFGCLESLKDYKSKYGYIPEYFQRTILYDVVWYCKYLVNNEGKLHFLSDDQKRRFISLMREIFTYIDYKVIVDFELAGCWFYFKIGILNCFKQQSPEFQIAYIEDYDARKNQVLVSYFSGNTEFESFTLDEQDILPVYDKTISNDFVGEIFAYERRCWIPLNEVNQTLKLSINGNASRLSLAGKQHRNGLKTETIKQHFLSKKHTFTDTSLKYQGCWILMDRDIQADDNAEHLYRYILNNHPEQNAYFALRKESHDWERLSREGFKLLAFGSKEHEQALRSCDKIISSHADVYVMNYFRDNTLLDKDFIFLQHGVTQNDMSGWFNTKRMAKLITAGSDEHQSIISPDSRYKFSEKEAVLTGFPRHDGLLENNDQGSKTILIMPTWRQGIVGKVTGSGNKRELNPDFMNTSFAQRWYGVLHSERLKNLAEEYGYEMIFFPHANIQPYLDQFNVPSYIKILSHTEASIQKLFQKSAMMITDYSSVAFEMAYLSKPVLYYQFDYDEVYSGGHICAKGYYDYKRDAFGPVVAEQDELLNELENTLVNGGKPSTVHQQRIDAFFPFKDGKCSERTYQAILEIDQPEATQISFARKLQYAEAASNIRNWDVAIARWQKVYDARPDDTYSKLKLAQALTQKGYTLQSKQLLDGVSKDIGEKEPDYTFYLNELANIFSLQNQWFKCEAVFGHILENKMPAISQMSGYLQSLAEQGKSKALYNYIRSYCDEPLTDIEMSLVQGFISWSNNEIYKAIEEFTFALESDQITQDILVNYKPQLILSKLLRLTGVFDAAHKYLVEYKKHTSNDPACRIEIAYLQSERGNFAKVISQLLKAYPEGVSGMASHHATLYITALRKNYDIQKAFDELATLEEMSSLNDALLHEKALLFMQANRWASAAAVLSELHKENKEHSFQLVKCLRMLGQLKEALDIILDAETPAPASSEEWLLRAEVAQLLSRWDIAAQSWGEHLRYYPESSPSWIWDRYQSAQMLNLTQIDKAA